MSGKNFLNSFSTGQLFPELGGKMPDYIGITYDPSTKQICLVDNRIDPANPAFKIACFNSGGLGLEEGAFSLAADGSSATINGEDAGGRLVNNGGGVFTLTIPTARKLKLGFINTQNNTLYFSEGQATGTQNSCNFNTEFAQALPDMEQLYIMQNDQANCIHLDSGQDFGNNGWTALIQNITNTSFDIVFTILGNGLSLDGLWKGLME